MIRDLCRVHRSPHCGMYCGWCRVCCERRWRCILGGGGWTCRYSKRVPTRPPAAAGRLTLNFAARGAERTQPKYNAFSTAVYGPALITLPRSLCLASFCLASLCLAQGRHTVGSTLLDPVVAEHMPDYADGNQRCRECGTKTCWFCPWAVRIRSARVPPVASTALQRTAKTASG